MKETFFVLVLIALVLFSTNTPARSSPYPRTDEFFVMRGKAVRIPIRVAIPIRVEFGPQQLRNVRDAVLDIINQPSFGALSDLCPPTALPPTPNERPQEDFQRTAPRNGKPRNPVLIDHFIGWVTYTPGNDLTSETDSFSYYVTHPITGKRVAGRIKILIGNASSISGK